MMTRIHIKDDSSRRYYHFAEFEAGERSTVAILRAIASHSFGDKAKIEVQGHKPWTGVLNNGGDQIPFEQFLATIGDGHD